MANTKNQSPNAGDLKIITGNELDLAAEFGLDLNASVEARLDRVVTKTNMAMRLVVEAGLDLISIKSECKHGEFETLLQDRGIASQRASEMMRVARFTANLPASERQKVMALHKTKAMLLANTDPAVIQQVMDNDDEFDDVTSMNYRAMRDRIRQLEAENANLETDLDTAEVRENELKARLNKERAASPYPDFVVVTRHEAAALSDKAQLSIDDLTRLGTDLVSMMGSGFYDARPENAHHIHIAASTLAIHLQAILAKAGAALQHLIDHLPPEAIGPVNADLLYSDDEISHALREHEDLVRLHEHEKQLREQKREMDKPRKPGRPKGSKNKDKE